jgi:hypothetical protein
MTGASRTRGTHKMTGVDGNACQPASSAAGLEGPDPRSHDGANADGLRPRERATLTPGNSLSVGQTLHSAPAQ